MSIKSLALASVLALGGLLAAGASEAQAAGRGGPIHGGGGPPVARDFHGPNVGYGFRGTVVRPGWYGGGFHHHPYRWSYWPWYPYSYGYPYYWPYYYPYSPYGVGF